MARENINIVNVPADFFDREVISTSDMRDILPGGQHLPVGSVLQKFARICQGRNRTQPTLKEIHLTSSYNLPPKSADLWGVEGCLASYNLPPKSMDLWGVEGCLGFQDLMQSGFLSSLEMLRISWVADFGDDGMASLAQLLNSSHLSSLRHLELDRLQLRSNGTKAICSWLQSGHAQNLESLRIKEDYWDRSALSLLVKSLTHGLVEDLANLKSLLTHGAVENVANLKSLTQGPVGNLANLDLDYGFLGEGTRYKKVFYVTELIHAFEVAHTESLQKLSIAAPIGMLDSLGQCTNLKNLKYLKLSDYGWKKTNDLTTFKRSAFRNRALRNLEELVIMGSSVESAVIENLFLSMEAGNFSCLLKLTANVPMSGRGVENMAKWLQSGRASNLAKLITKCLFSSLESASIIDACFSGRTEKLEILKVKAKFEILEVKAKFLDDNVLKWVRELAMGRLPRLRVFWMVPRGLPSNAVLQAILNAYKENKYLTVRLWEDKDFPSVDNSKPMEGILNNLRRKQTMGGIRTHLLNNQSRKQTLEALEKEPWLPGIHGKVFLCGSPGVGKTTLRQTFQKTWKSQLFASKKLEPTRGIEVNHLQITGKDPNTHEVQLAFWDLAGQHEFEVLHSTFLPDLAMGDGQATFFIVVCSANASKESNVNSARDALLYWLRFISSNSRRVTDEDRHSANSAELSRRDLRRRVLVVLNCFEGQKSVHNLEEWNTILADCQETFKGFLNLHPQPFIIDVRKWPQAKPVKEHLYAEAQEVLQHSKVPQTSALILDGCRTWAAEDLHRKFPVSSWNNYIANVVTPGWSLQTVKAATFYLHDTGHIILFPKLSKSDYLAEEHHFDDQTVVVLDPEWLCERVIGHLLLPEHLLKKGEEGLRSNYLRKDGALRLALVQKHLFEIPKKNCEDLFRIMVRLGLGYTLSADHDHIFVPALIQENELPIWLSKMDQSSTLLTSCSWVMGFAVSAKDCWTTLLPVSILRKLQVQLAQDDEIGRGTGSDFRAAVSRIWFKWEGMGFLVEYHGDSRNSQHNRLDVLVKPLAENGCESEADARLERRRQITLAETIVSRVLDVALDCPGLELKRSVIRPWACGNGVVLLKDRDVSCSVEELTNELRRKIERRTGNRQQNNLWTTNWTVCGRLVECQDVLGEDDWRSVAGDFEKRCELTEFSLEQLGMLEPPSESERHERNAGAESSSDQEDRGNGASTRERAESRTDAITLQRIWSEVRALRRDMHLRFDHLGEDLQRVTERLQKVLKLQDSLNKHVLSLEAFTVMEKQSSIPRFVYLTSREGTGGAWKRTKDVFTEEIFLHFLCEAGCGDSKLHEVDGQLGINLRYFKGWAEKLAPILDWSLKIAFVAAKVAGIAVLPGLGLLLPNLSNDLVSNGSIWATSVGDVLKSCSDSVDRPRPKLDVNETKEKDVRGAARATVKKLLDALSPSDFERKVSLRRVRILDSYGATGEVVWICNGCLQSYGSRAQEI